MIVADTALGKGHDTLPAFFPSFVFPGLKPGKTKLGKKAGIHVGFLTQGGAPLALGYYPIVPTGHRFGSLRSRNGQMDNEVKGLIGLAWAVAVAWVLAIIFRSVEER